MKVKKIDNFAINIFTINPKYIHPRINSQSYSGISIYYTKDIWVIRGAPKSNPTFFNEELPEEIVNEIKRRYFNVIGVCPNIIESLLEED